MNFIDAFCGCGGASLGLIKAGLRHFRSFDFNADALASYQVVTGCHAQFADLSKTSLSTLAGDNFKGLFWLSPPCQPISRMQNKSRDCRVDLLCSVLTEAIEAFPDSWVVFENVDNILNFGFFESILGSIIRARGVVFDVARAKDFVLEAVSVGVAQDRTRLILPIPPRGWRVPAPIKKCTPALTFRHVIGDGFVDHDPDSWMMSKAEKAAMHANLNGFCPKNVWDDLPPCVIASKRVWLHSGRFNHPSLDRRLTVGECMAIQGLPPVKLFGNLESRYKQTGNAVPPAMSEAIGKSILSAGKI